MTVLIFVQKDLAQIQHCHRCTGRVLFFFKAWVRMGQDIGILNRAGLVLLLLFDLWQVNFNTVVNSGVCVTGRLVCRFLRLVLIIRQMVAVA